jgi:hypothetical protein
MEFKRVFCITYKVREPAFLLVLLTATKNPADIASSGFLIKDTFS